MTPVMDMRVCASYRVDETDMNELNDKGFVRTAVLRRVDT